MGFLELLVRCFKDGAAVDATIIVPLVPLVPLAPLATPVTLVLSRLLLFQSVAGPKSLEALQEFQELPRRLLAQTLRWNCQRLNVEFPLQTGGG